MTNEIFPNALRRLRREERMTMKELSDESGVSQSYISQLENGVRLPSVNILRNIALSLARGKSYVDEDPFSDFYGSHFYTYKDEFEVETRKDDILEVLTVTRKNSEDEKLKKEYISTIKATTITALEENATNKIELSSDELHLLKSFKKADENQQKNIISYIEFLLNN